MTAQPEQIAARSCKIGTVPALVVVHGKDKVAPGNAIRIKEGRGAKWTRVYVETVNPDGYFVASR